METGTIQQQIAIKAPDFNVWDVLTNNHRINEWAAEFGEGVHAETDWAEGSEINWKDANDEICAHGIVTINRVYDTIRTDFYRKTNPKLTSPTGRYQETFSLKKQGETTILSITAGPLSEEEIATETPHWEHALQKIKELAEKE